MIGLGDGIAAIDLEAMTCGKWRGAHWWRAGAKQVDRRWLEVARAKPGFRSYLDCDGSAADEADARLSQGTHEVVYAVDPEARVKYRIVRPDGSILLAQVRLRA